MYCNNNPLNRADITGLKDPNNILQGLGDWVNRNWDNVASIGLSMLEVSAGIGLSATGVGAAVGVPMIIHGGANVVAQEGKIMATTLTQITSGSKSADKLDNNLPDSAIGFAFWAPIQGATSITGYDTKAPEKAGAIGDIVDGGVGILLGGKGTNKAIDAINDVANTGAKFGKATKESLFMTKKLNESNFVGEVFEGIANTLSNAKTLKDTTDKIKD